MKSIVSGFFLVLLAASCHPQPKPPETAYDPALLEASREAAREQELERQQQAQQAEQVQPVKGQCSREEGGCPPGYFCWDSYFCKQGFTDQCTASGDKRCHKLCDNDADCPHRMPHCRAKPIFSGSERGSEVKFCVAE